MYSVELLFSSSDSEEDNSRKLEAARRRRIRDSSNPLEMEDALFKSNFRVSKAAFSYLLSQTDHKFRPATRCTFIPNILKLAATLRFLAQGSYQLIVGNNFFIGLAQSTVSVVLKEALTILEEHICDQWINLNYTVEEKNQAKMSFYEKCGIPGIIGCIDGTHIAIVAPKREIQHLYYNRKGFHSINAMVVCDHETKIRCLNARHPGATHDSMVLNMSSFKTKMEEDQENGQRNTWFLGDSGYPLKPYLLTPYRNAAEGAETTYNRKHAEARSIIERTIGILKSRFRCLLKARSLHYAPEKATQITNVCGALHNIYIFHNVAAPEANIELLERDAAELHGTEEELFREQSRAAVDIRNNIAGSLR